MRDPYKNQERWNSWKEKNKKKIEGVSLINSKLILEFLNDMERGMNTPASKKGRRKPITLINLKDHICFFARNIKKPLISLTKTQIHNFEDKIIKGDIRKQNGDKFSAFGNYIKDFKVFWSWLLRTGKVKENITIDLSKKTKKPAWVYLKETQFKKLANRCNPDYKALTWFMYDAGLRVTEAYSIKIKNFNEDYTELTIPDEVAKTFGRTIKLKLCTQLIKEYVKHHDLKADDYLFIKKPPAFNKYLQTLSKKLFGDKESKARKTYDKFSLYDIRHNASCYWLKRYQKGRSLMYRMGWKREEMILYYSEFLGLRDDLQDEDMVLTEDKNGLEKLKQEFESKIEKLEKENETMFDAIKQRNKTDRKLNPQISEAIKKMNEQIIMMQNKMQKVMKKMS